VGQRGGLASAGAGNNQQWHIPVLCRSPLMGIEISQKGIEGGLRGFRRP
jgi:hypothetical protein